MAQNLEVPVNENPEISPQEFITDATRCLYNDLEDTINCNCVGVMIQAGKTLTSPTHWMQTSFGGHVSVFTIQNGILSSWDEIAQDNNNRWQKTTNDSIVELIVDHQNHLMYPSQKNDVTCYMHVANDEEINSVVDRANRLADENHSHHYRHWIRFGESNEYGDCVSLSAWVMQAFSYSTKISGRTTPWAEALKYEAYANPLNFLSKWYKVKYIGRKLAVMT